MVHQNGYSLWQFQAYIIIMIYIEHFFVWSGHVIVNNNGDKVHSQQYKKFPLITDLTIISVQMQMV